MKLDTKVLIQGLEAIEATDSLRGRPLKRLRLHRVMRSPRMLATLQARVEQHADDDPAAAGDVANWLTYLLTNMDRILAFVAAIIKLFGG